MGEKPSEGLGAAPKMAPKRDAAMAREPLREPMRAKRRLTDDEVRRMFAKEEGNQFEIDEDVIESGFRYVWKAQEVYGQPLGSFNPAKLEKQKFYPVMAEEHPGYFKPIGHTGHVIRDGLGLYKLEEENYELRERRDQIAAKDQVADQEQVLGIAPPGQGPRDHPTVRPKIRTNYEPANVE